MRKLSRFKIVLISLLILGLVAGGFAYFKYREFAGYLIDQVNSQAGKKLGRQIKFKKISFSVLEGVIIDEPCVSRAPDFTKGNFFCAARAVIRPEISQLMRKRVYFANIELEKPVIKIRETGGKWDYEDLLALLPKTSKGLYITWNARKLVLKNATLEIDRSSGNSFALENADLALLHYSDLAGNFSLGVSGDIKTVLNDQLVKGRASVKTELNFEYSGLTSAFGGAEFSDASMGAATLKKVALNWQLFNINKPAVGKNYTVGVKAEELFIPAQSCDASRAVNKALELISSAMGKATTKCEDIEMTGLAFDFSLKDGVFRIDRLDLAANFMNLQNKYEINGPARTVDIELSAASGDNRLDLTARGPMDKPEILPVMSVTLNKKLTEAVRNINAAILKIFPVGEKSNV